MGQFVMGGEAKGESRSTPASLNQGLWAYRRIDPVLSEKLAYEMHSKSGCSYGVFAGMLAPLSESYGEPYRSFPLKMMEFATRGIGGYGICGGLIAGAAAIGLFHDGKIRNELITRLLRWYEETELPMYRPSQPLASDAEIPTVKAQSVLCSNSIAAWRQKASVVQETKERVERCYRLSADICRKTVELLNESIDGQ